MFLFDKTNYVIKSRLLFNFYKTTCPLRFFVHNEGPLRTGGSLLVIWGTGVQLGIGKPPQSYIDTLKKILPIHAYIPYLKYRPIHIYFIYLKSRLYLNESEFTSNSVHRMGHEFRSPHFSLLPPFFQNFHNHSFFNIFIIILFFSFDNKTSYIMNNTCILCPQFMLH